MAGKPGSAGGIGAEGEAHGAASELRSFLRRTSQLLTCESLEEALDVSEELLIEASDFLYFRLYLRSGLRVVRSPEPAEGRGMVLVRGACPAELQVAWDVVDWAVAGNEVALFPTSVPGCEARSMVAVPLAGRTLQLGVVLLWVEFGEDEFTAHAADLLRAYGTGLSAALEGMELAQQRAEAQALVQHVLEGVPLGILSVQRDGLVRLVNGTAEYMLGRSRRELMERSCWEVLPADVSVCFRKMIDALEGGEDPGEVELKLSGPGHDQYILGVTGSRLPTPGDGGDAGYVLVLRDLEVTKEIVRLRQLDAMKDDLLSLVSHELRTPLASIMAYAEALLMEGMVETEAERREYLEVIRSEGERLNRLISDILDLTKMQAGKMEYRLAEQDLNSVVKHAANVEAGLAQQKGVKVILELAPDLSPIRIDRDRIVQVVCNLMSNAIKYTNAGGRVTVSTSAAEQAPQEGASQEIRVADTGVGIPAGQIHKVWSRFEQVEGTRHHTGGTGLGMPICRQIIEEGHGGKIWLTSEVGVGTTVYCRLPL